MAVTRQSGNYKIFGFWIATILFPICGQDARAPCHFLKYPFVPFRVFRGQPSKIPKKKGKPACCLPLIAAPYSTNLNIYLHRFAHTNA